MNRAVGIYFRAVLIFLALGFSTGCDETLAGKWKYEEQGRFTSPDALVDAVLVTGDAGATTSTETYVYLVPKGGKATTNEQKGGRRPVFVADHLKNFHLSWRQPKLLEMSFEEARIDGFINYWSAREIQDFHYVVEIQLHPVGTNSFLPWSDRFW